jgi:hypothetical protein
MPVAIATCVAQLEHGPIDSSAGSSGTVTAMRPGSVDRTAGCPLLTVFSHHGYPLTATDPGCRRRGCRLVARPYKAHRPSCKWRLPISWVPDPGALPLARAPVQVLVFKADLQPQPEAVPSDSGLTSDSESGCHSQAQAAGAQAATHHLYGASLRPGPHSSSLSSSSSSSDSPIEQTQLRSARAPGRAGEPAREPVHSLRLTLLASELHWDKYEVYLVLLNDGAPLAGHCKQTGFPLCQRVHCHIRLLA